MLYDFGFLTIWLLDDVEATLQAGQAATVGRENGGGSMAASPTATKSLLLISQFFY